MTRVGEVEEVMAQDNRTIKELSASGLDNAARLCIQYPAAAQGKTEEFELKSSLLHHIPKYHGLSMEDPNKHLKEFEVVCSSMTPINVDGSILKMKAFPFSLMDKAKDWLYELAPGTVASWESMKRIFLEKFFPTSRVILLRKRISGIQQEEGHANQGQEGGRVGEASNHVKKWETSRNSPTTIQISPNKVEEVIIEEEEQGLAMARKEVPLSQVSMAPKPSNLPNKGASINVMPYSIYASMNLGELKNDGVIIQLADRSNAYPKGVLEDVLVQVDNLIFPADFYVLEMENSPNVTPLPILLGRPFMKTTRTKIDVFKGTLTMEFDGEIINFNISEAMKFPKDDQSCFSIDVLDELEQDYLDMLEDDPLETTIAQGIGMKPNLAVPKDEHAELVAALESLP
ncbi:unnamed protein product [Malus baccata var. baccata]